MATERKPRAKRRNFEKLVVGTVAYCNAAIDTCAGIRAGIDKTPEPTGSLAYLDSRMSGQMDALKSVLKRLGETEGGGSE